MSIGRQAKRNRGEQATGDRQGRSIGCEEAVHQRPVLEARANVCEDKMANVFGVQPAGAPGAVESVGKATRAVPAPSAQGVSDVVEISLAAQLAAKLQEVPAVRADLVAQVKGEIAAGTYETPQRVEVAVDRLLSDLLGR
jgi:negative regulator of flagellin synthesis FlgM